VYIGDFNSHITEWGYKSDNTDEEMLSNWVNINHIYFIYDAKQASTFNSERLGTTSSPNLYFVTKDHNGTSRNVKHQITNKVPKNQHRPIILDVGLALPRINRPEMKGWNLCKANWVVYSKYVEENID